MIALEVYIIYIGSAYPGGKNIRPRRRLLAAGGARPTGAVPVGFIPFTCRPPESGIWGLALQTGIG